MRRLTCAALLVAGIPGIAAAEIGNSDDCRAALVADPARAREDAAVWERTGGGVPARLCSAAALAALGAHATAAQMLTSVAENPNRAMSPGLRATVLADAASQWLAAGKPGIARDALARADRITPPDAPRHLLVARAAAAQTDWPAAETSLRAALETGDDPLVRALLAAALRNQGQGEAALAEADRARVLSPDLPEAQFEQGAARAVTGDPEGASEAWFALIAASPDSGLAALARVNLQRLPAAAPPPTRPLPRP